MSVWLVVMVYLSKLATLRQTALFDVYLLTYLLYICTNDFESFCVPAPVARAPCLPGSVYLKVLNV